MLFEKIPKKKREDYLKDLLDYVVEKNGLASVPKSDLEACFVYLYKKHVDPTIDIYNLSKIFRVKETKLKNLMQLFYIKFDRLENLSEEEFFLSLLENTKYEIESFEKVQISFHFNQIEAFPLIQYQFRKVNGSVKYDKNSESIIVNQNRYYDLLDNLWNSQKSKENYNDIKEKIKNIIGLLAKSIDDEMKNELRRKKSSNLYKSLHYASKLEGIGTTVVNLYKSEPFNLWSAS